MTELLSTCPAREIPGPPAWALRECREVIEASVLSGCLQCAQVTLDLRRKITPEMFSDVRNRVLWNVLSSITWSFTKADDEAIIAAFDAAASQHPPAWWGRNVHRWFLEILDAAPPHAAYQHAAALLEIHRRDRMRLALQAGIEAIERGARAGEARAVVQEVLHDVA